MSIKQVICVLAVALLVASQAQSELVPKDLKAPIAWSSRNQEIPENLQDSIIYLLPKIEGKTRYQFEIPREGLNRASRYQDAGPLYYLTSFNDTGLRFTNTDMLAVSIMPKSLEFDFFRPKAAFDGRYSIGLGFSNWTKKSLETFISVGYAKIVRKETLLAARLKVDENMDAKSTFGITFLNAAETVQYTGWLEYHQQTKEPYKFSLQSKVFDALWDIDGALQLSHSNKENLINTTIFKDFANIKSSLGFEWSEKSKNLEILVGFTSYLKNKNGNFLRFQSNSKSEAVPPGWLDDLKPHRKVELMRHWTAQIGSLFNN